MDKLSHLLYRQISGKRFKDILGVDCKYLIKIMNDDDVHYDMKYQIGINVDIVPFNPNGKCSGGGIHFCHIQDFGKWYSRYGEYIRLVEIEDDAKVYVEEHMIKADKVTLSLRRDRNTVLKELMMSYYRDYPEKTLQIIRQHGWAIKFIDQKHRTEEMMMDAVRRERVMQSTILNNDIGQNG